MYFIALHVLRRTDVVIALHVNDRLMLLVVELLELYNSRTILPFDWMIKLLSFLKYPLQP